jgi:hypothetical protein
LAFAESRAGGVDFRAMKRLLSDRKNRKVKEDRPEPARVESKFTARGEGGDKSRILVAVSGGKFDFKAMSPEATKVFNELMHTPEVQAQFGIGPLIDRFDPAHCKRFYDALGRVLQTVGRFAFKWPREALEKLPYTEQEKEELAEPTARALDELAPQILKENQALVVFLAVFGAITSNKLQEAGAVAHLIRLRDQGKPEHVNSTANAIGGEPVRRGVSPTANGN